jgi:hypothetical protein
LTVRCFFEENRMRNVEEIVKSHLSVWAVSDPDERAAQIGRVSNQDDTIVEPDGAVVHAAAGGVGLLLTQMIKARGGDLLAILTVVGDFQLIDRVIADVPCVHDLVMEARDRFKECG